MFTGKYVYLKPDEISIFKIQRLIGCEMLSRASTEKHCTLCFGIDSDVDRMSAYVRKIVQKIFRKYNRTSYDITFTQIMLSPDGFPMVLLTPEPNSVDWKILADIRTEVLLTYQYAKYVKINTPLMEKIQNTFLNSGGVTEKVSSDNELIFPHISLFKVNEAELEKYKTPYLLAEPIVVTFKFLGASFTWLDSKYSNDPSSHQENIHKFRLEDDLPSLSPSS